jgi:hypothetical protein
MNKIIVNKARCRNCKTIIESKTVHDFVECKCGKIFVDGGKDYLRRGGDEKFFEDLSEWKEE